MMSGHDGTTMMGSSSSSGSRPHYPRGRGRGKGGRRCWRVLNTTLCISQVARGANLHELDELEQQQVVQEQVVSEDQN
ncbi:unnamed protein product, partial [Amoebophrya sp. A25]|eukprot:GSA25T00017824001.1